LFIYGLLPDYTHFQRAGFKFGGPGCESVAFLEAMRKKQRAASISAILDEILQTVRREHELASNERAVVEYYDSLSTEEAADQSRWVEVALHEFPNEERA
jgi:hypothetical protein